MAALGTHAQENSLGIRINERRLRKHHIAGHFTAQSQCKQ